MGGGSSALREMDEIVTCTYLLGRAIAAMSFPGDELRTNYCAVPVLPANHHHASPRVSRLVGATTRGSSTLGLGEAAGGGGKGRSLAAAGVRLRRASCGLLRSPLRSAFEAPCREGARV